MAIPQFEVDMDIIAKLGEYPGSDDGLTPAGFKAKFDLAGKFLQEYINTILLPGLDNIVDVQSLLNNILDETLSKENKAAPAKAVGDIIRSLNTQFNINQAIFFEKTVQSGDYVLSTDRQFRANIVNPNTVRVLGGEAVVQGHVMSLNVGGNQELSISSGIYGVYRNDLICARFRRYSDGTEDHSLVVIEGTQNQTGGVDPEYYTDNINVMGAVTYDFPLYRVKVTGVNVELEQLFKIQKSLTETITESVIESINRWEGGSY